MPRATARVPTTPETHKKLRAVKDEREDVETFDELLRSYLREREH